jgi:hypothetical protein
MRYFGSQLSKPGDHRYLERKTWERPLLDKTQLLTKRCVPSRWFLETFAGACTALAWASASAQVPVQTTITPPSNLPTSTPALYDLIVPVVGQQQSNWCWAAVGVMVDNYDSPLPPVTECGEPMLRSVLEVMMLYRIGLKLVTAAHLILHATSVTAARLPNIRSIPIPLRHRQ